MLRFVALLMVSLTAAPLLAQPVKVSSGEHPDFTRLVLEYSAPVDWALGRTPDGYELRLPGEAAQYDLSKAFDLIKKDRLAAIWADPDTGALHLSIGCSCFAMPFEFRPGTVVIDIRNGPPPKGSSFELPLDGGVAVTLAPRPVIRPVKRPFPSASAPDTDVSTASGPIYDWTATLLSPPPGGTGQANSDHLPDLALANTTHLNLEPLRQSLIEELSRGASQGIVEMAKPRKLETDAKDGGNPSVEIRLGDAPNLVLRQKGEAKAPLTAEGAECIPDDKLDVAAWADETPVFQQFGPAMSGLTGEFDKPEQDAIKHAIQFYLNLGFGAEARSLIRAFATEHDDAAIWSSMARMLDDEADPKPAFADMAACDTAAALWAVLADPQTLSVGQVEKSAILRAFSALPNHLRRQLGPKLVDRFLGMGDFPTAISLRDAVLRGTSEGGPEIELMQAAIERADGSPSASEARLEDVASESGPKTAEALVALVTQRAEMGQDVTFDQVEVLKEYTEERHGSEAYPAFSHALTLALGASGDFDSAFGRLDENPQAAATLWQILGSSGPDSALLAIATLNERQPPPQAATGAASLIATRMLKLGFADQAARWLDLAEAPPVLLTARVRLAEGRPQEALDLLQGVESPGAFPVRIEALRALGDRQAEADLFAEAGMEDDQWSTITRMQDWESLAAAGPDLWKVAAEQLVGAPPSAAISEAQADPTAAESPTGLLAKSQELLSTSAGTRDAINALLDAVRSPASLTQ